MAKTQPQVDVAVLGDHPAAYLAAALLKHNSRLRVIHATLPGPKEPDRLVVINARLFSLHPLLEFTRRRLDLKSVFGLRFLADDPATSSEYRSKSAVATVGQLKDVRSTMRDLAEKNDVELLSPKQVIIHRADEHGVEITLGNAHFKPKALIVSDTLELSARKILGIPEEWETGVVRRYTFTRCKGTKNIDLGGKPLIPMSLDLAGMLCWAWLLVGDNGFQLCLEQPLNTLAQKPPATLLRHWAQVLFNHKVLRDPLDIKDSAIESLDLPLGGALAHEGLANRTLLIGPAGGFYSAGAEDIYPNCWSAIFAADVLKKSFKEPHLQDALQVYRQKWRTTLGDYLRGPQQNLRFLLPLVYRNQNMTDRLAEAIFTGKSVVR